jgi:hypothetical protein
VLSQLSWNTWHVGRLSRKDILVFFKKVSELKFLFLREVDTDDRRLGGVTSTQIDFNSTLLRGRCDDACLLSQNFCVFRLSLPCEVGNLLCFIGLLCPCYNLDSFRVTVT